MSAGLAAGWELYRTFTGTSTGTVHWYCSSREYIGERCGRDDVIRRLMVRLCPCLCRVLLAKGSLLGA